jgi:hypothetical protein
MVLMAAKALTWAAQESGLTGAALEVVTEWELAPKPDRGISLFENHAGVLFRGYQDLRGLHFDRGCELLRSPRRE